MIEDQAFEIVEGSHSVVVGDGTASTITNFYGINAPAGGTGGNQSGGPGGNGGSGGGGGATFGGDTAYGMNVAGTPIAGYGNDGSTSRGNPQTQSGGGGGAATAGGLTGAAGLGRANNISGAEIVYATGGSVGAAPGLEGSGNGGLGAVTNGESGSFGGSGVVIVAYEISSAFNVASGGTETIVDDYNGSGQQWKVHDFGNSGGTFTVESSTRPFRVMAAGQPGAGGAVASGRGGGGGGGGEVLDVEKSFTAGDYPVTPYSVNGVSARSGGGGMPGWSVPSPGVGGASGNGNPGGPQSSDGWSAGGGGGAGGAGANSGGNNCAGGGGGISTNISGSNQTLGTGGGGGAQNNGCSGQAGKVVVAYQIGVSTIAQIKVAQTVRKAELRKQQLEEKAFQKQEALKAKLRK